MPPPMPPKLNDPRLNPDMVMPHCLLPRAFCQALVMALQICPWMALNRLVGIEQVDDHVEADALEDVVETGQRLDRLRCGDVFVVGGDAGGGGVGRSLIERRAGGAAGRLRGLRQRAGGNGGEQGDEGEKSLAHQMTFRAALSCLCSIAQMTSEDMRTPAVMRVRSARRLANCTAFWMAWEAPPAFGVKRPASSASR